MLRPGIHTWSFRNLFTDKSGFNIFQAIDLAADMGFTAMEIMTGKAGAPPDHIGGDDLKHLQKVCNAARKAGIEVCCFATYNDFAFVKDEDWRLANIEYIKTWLKLSGDVGVPNIRMLTGYMIEGEDRRRLEQLVVDGIRECIPVAEAAGVNMAIENHNSLFFDGEEMVALIKRLGSERLTTCPDPSNGYKVFADDCPPETYEAMYRNLKVMAPLATEAHLKIDGADGESIKGFDLSRLLRTFATAGYDGPIMFEATKNGLDLDTLRNARIALDNAINDIKETK